MSEFHMKWIMKSMTLVLAIGCLGFATGCATPAKEIRPTSSLIRAHRVVTMANDFVVEVYHNGVRVPDARRKLLLDRFGAMAESTQIDVLRGDWLVFHVVNNRLRWDGQYYFGVAGVIVPGEFGFVSELNSGAWSICDNPEFTGRFIREKGFMADNRALPVEKPWHEGKAQMDSYSGGPWPGQPIWGRERSTWIKVVVQ